MKIIISNTNIGALLKTTDNILSRYDKDDVPDKLRGQATLSALKDMFSSRTFSICDVDSMMKLNDVRISKEKYDLMRTIHCVAFANMTEEMREYLFATLVDAFKGNIVMSQSNHETETNS